MKILILSPMLSSSSFITVYPYAKILSKYHDVKIVGPLFGKKLYIHDKNLKFEYIEPKITKPVQIGMLSLFSRNLSRLMKGDYDVVHAFKLLPHTGPVAAIAKKRLGKKFILTIDDYDAAGGGRNPIKKFFLKESEKAYKHSDSIFVSSTLLQKKYGGEIIYQVPNEKIFLKKNISGQKIRKKFGLESKIIIMYAGTLYGNKGLDVLIKSVQKLKNKNVKLLIIGSTLLNKEVEYLKKIAGEETIFVGQVPISDMPQFVAACDIYVIPTKNTPYTRAEIPAKIFEPMMLSKAIIASRLSDIPIILNDGKSGMLVKPGSVDDLAKKISILTNDKRLRKNFGKKAKERYFNNYSYDQIEKKINNVYRSLGI